jgi:hypothetical protein
LSTILVVTVFPAPLSPLTKMLWLVGASRRIPAPDGCCCCGPRLRGFHTRSAFSMPRIMARYASSAVWYTCGVSLRFCGDDGGG